jgi:hypothetical protein
MDLPAPLLEADARLERILARYRLAEHLNPVNAAEARQVWRTGSEAPPLAYAPALWADEALTAIDAVRPPLDHPLGRIVAGAAQEFRLFVLALRERTAAAFDALAVACSWYPEDLGLPDHLRRTAASSERATVSAREMVEVLAAAVRERGHTGWSVRMDPVLASRVLVDAPRREVRVNPRASFRPSDRASLVAHEIDVHVQRSINGGAQPLAVFRNGLPCALATEEGLAIAAEEHAGVSTAHLVDRQAIVAGAVLHARAAGFREVHEVLSDRVGPEAAWAITVRVKRGLADPAAPGVYAKDAVYHIGYTAVRAYLTAGGSLGALYVGKVGIDHPVSEWIAAGWVRAMEPPAFWFSPPG